MNETLISVHKMQAYIAAHFDEEITWQDLARVTAYSPWHAHRLFTNWTNVTPAEYIRRLRLSKSAMELRDTGVKVSEVAYRYGFTTPEGYQRAFAKEFGMNPLEYAKHPVPIPLFIPYPILDPEGDKPITMNEKTTPIFITRIERPARKLILKRGRKADNYWDYSQEVGCDVWGTLMSIKSIVNEPVGVWLPSALVLPHTSSYVQGVEVGITETIALPEGFEEIMLPAAAYLMFQSAPFKEEQYESAIASVWDAIKVYSPTALGLQWDDTQPRMQLEPRGERGYIELCPVKPL